jgi:lipopolysaccharide export system permease protein
MLARLDWYILKKFFVTFIFCMLLFTVIAVAVDSSEKTDDFVKAGLTTHQIIFGYYVGFVPFIWGLLYPLFVFIAVIFFTSKMALQSEVIAILASGVTYQRWLRPYIIGGFFFALVLWFANRYVIPQANEIRSNFQAKYLDRNDFQRTTGTYYMRADANTYIGVKDYDTTTKQASSFFLERVKGDKVYYNLRANAMRWDAKKNRWVLTDAVERTIDTMQEHVKSHQQLYINLNLKPADLRRDDYLKDKLTTPELRRFINAEEARGIEGLNTLKVEQYRRSATPFTVLLLTMIGAIIAGRKTRGGSGLHLAIGIGIAAVFILSDRFSTVFSTKSNLPPLLAAWIPNIVFTLVAYYMYRRAPK